jgi:PAS domain S-box-containing protein
MQDPTTEDAQKIIAELTSEVQTLRRRLAELEAAAPADGLDSTPPDAALLLQQVLDHLPMSICWKDSHSVFLGCNHRFAQSFGFEHPHLLIGKTDYDLTSRKYADMYRADDQKVIETGISKINFEEPLTLADGSPGWLMTTKVPLRDSKGAVVGVLVALEDITERKREEEERARQQDEYIQMQAGMLAELSTPLIPITADVVVMPLVGSIDSRRAQQVLDSLLSGIAERSARIAILDITGVPIVDTHVASALIRAAQAVQLLGAQVVLTGIRPEVAQTLVGMGTVLQGIVTRSDLQSGITFATQYR